VCNILTLGKQLSDCKCETVANAHEIIAWLPMMDAAIAMTNVGQNKTPELAIESHYVNFSESYIFEQNENPTIQNYTCLLGVDL
jgi:hypothetical protein